MESTSCRKAPQNALERFRRLIPQYQASFFWRGSDAVWEHGVPFNPLIRLNLQQSSEFSDFGQAHICGGKPHVELFSATRDTAKHGVFAQ